MDIDKNTDHNIEEIDNEQINDETEINTEINTKYDQLLQQFQIYKADQINANKANAKYLEQQLRQANSKIIEDLIPVVDGFEMALQTNDSSMLCEGIKMLQNQLETVLKKYGVEKITPSSGMIFNPDEHQVLSTIESESLQTNQIESVIQSGYKLNGRILRAARVVVVKNKD